MKFRTLASYFSRIENTTSRLTITQILAELFNKLTPNEIEKTPYLLQGRVVPLYNHTEFGIAEKMVIKSIILALNMERQVFKKYYDKIGDLGKALEYYKREVQTLEEKDLSVLEVHEKLYELAIANGEGSQERKIQILSLLIRNLDPLSCRYIVRIPQSSMRLGFSDMTILDGYSWMLDGDKQHRALVEKAYHVRPDLGYIGCVLKKEGIKGLKRIRPVLFTPILMMRAERLSSSLEIVEKLGKALIEPKYDGFRLQIHYKRAKNEVRLYSRNLEEVTFMYPDIAAGIRREVKADKVILEGEAVGFDPQTGSFLPFQETVQRKRKYEIEAKAKEIPLKLFVFELLYLNGESCLSLPYLKRRRLLKDVIKISGDIFKDTVLIYPEYITDKAKEIDLLFDEAISKGLEGIIAKKLDGVYQPGARGWNWIKFKRSYSAKVEDTIDCLVMGYDYGRGKRAGFGIGAFLVGVYDERQDKFYTIAKIGTGLSDIEWKELKKRANKFTADNKPALYEVDKQMGVDVWIKPEIVVEIRADEITRSPVHTAGRILRHTKTGSAYEVDIPGYALRFPRLERFRDDKKPEDTTTLKELSNIYKAQKR